MVFLQLHSSSKLSNQSLGSFFNVWELHFCLHPLHPFEPSQGVPQRAKSEERCEGMPCISAERPNDCTRIFDLMELMAKFTLIAVRSRVLS